jgi:hypothetical protein
MSAGMKAPQQQPSAQQPAPTGAADAEKSSSSAPASRASPVPVAGAAGMGSASPAQQGTAGHSTLLRAPSSPITPGLAGAAPPGHREKGMKARRAAAGSEVRGWDTLAAASSSAPAQLPYCVTAAIHTQQTCCTQTVVDPHIGGETGRRKHRQICGLCTKCRTGQLMLLRASSVLNNLIRPVRHLVHSPQFCLCSSLCLPCKHTYAPSSSALGLAPPF